MSNKTLINSKKQQFINFKEVYNYRDLFWTLSWKDYRIRYAQTTLGFLWAIIQPLITLIILNLVFGKFVGVKTDVPHILFTVAGTSLWSYFSYVLTNSGSSIINNQNMVKKIYFPRIIIPLSKSIVGFIDFGIAILILIILMFYFKITPSENFIFAPFFIVFGILTALSIGITLSAITIKHRDFQHVVPFIIQIGLYITPIGYPAEFAINNLPKWAEKIYFLNPMAGVIQGFRWSIFGGLPPGEMTIISLLVTILFLFFGLRYFSKIDGEIADFV